MATEKNFKDQKSPLPVDQAVAARFVIFRQEIIKCTQAELAVEAGVNVRTVNFYENGRYLPGRKMITYLQRRYSLNSEWLMTGKGDPTSKAKHDPDSIANTNTRLVMLEKKVEDLQETIKSIIQKLQES